MHRSGLGVCAGWGGGGCVCAELTVYVCVAWGAGATCSLKGRLGLNCCPCLCAYPPHRLLPPTPLRRVFARKQAQAGPG